MTDFARVRAVSRTAFALCLAALACSAAAEDPHVVRPGETLWGIAGERLDAPLRWPEIQQRNKLGPPRQLQPGTVLTFADGQLQVANDAAVLGIQGSAWRQREAQEIEPLAPGMLLRAGDVLHTDHDAFVTLSMPDGSKSVLPSNSTLELLSVGPLAIRLKLIKGRIESQVQKLKAGHRFEIRARSVNVGVRGTHFRVRDEDGLLVGEVLAGKVAVRSMNPQGLGLDLHAGQGAVLAVSGTDDGTHRLRQRPQALLPGPRLLAPVTRTRTLSVQAITGATEYRAQFARDPDFLQLAYELRESAPQFAVPDRIAGGLYHLRLTAFDADGVEGKPGDEVVYLPDPAEVTVHIAQDGRVELRWHGLAGGRMRVQIAKDEDLAQPLVDETTFEGAGVRVGPLPRPGRYHWRVSNSEGFVTSGNFELPAR